MSIWAVVLVVISALLHASWNIIGKANKGSVQAFFFMTTFLMAFLLSPFLLWFYFSAGPQVFSIQFWYLLFISGIFQIIYLVALGFAYQNADVGVVYPMARAIPVMMVGGLVLLLGQVVMPMQWLGFLLITSGCLLVPLTSLRQFKLSPGSHIGIAWAIIAAIGTTGYSIVDKLALAELFFSLKNIHQPPLIALFYLGMQFWATTLPFALGFLVTRQSYQFKQAWDMKCSAFITGLIMASTYGLVLYAMLLTDNVSLVVALRQVSIIFGLLFAVIFLKEKIYLTRLIGCGLIFSGLIFAL
ncbi:EamA family transporter [Psychromonas hadalis]|uniref:EamA family transporter n=1 Tax=Psychromonas hadalis TaxID=211669 RepID=UPI0003B4859C|nr:EamA family transporter [Psychromonas hadalis]